MNLLKFVCFLFCLRAEKALEWLGKKIRCFDRLGFVNIGN